MDISTNKFVMSFCELSLANGISMKEKFMDDDDPADIHSARMKCLGAH